MSYQPDALHGRILSGVGKPPKIGVLGAVSMNENKGNIMAKKAVKKPVKKTAKKMC